MIATAARVVSAVASPVRRSRKVRRVPSRRPLARVLPVRSAVAVAVASAVAVAAASVAAVVVASAVAVVVAAASAVARAPWWWSSAPRARWRRASW